MEGRKQNIEHLSDQSAQGVELGAMIGMQTFMWITENGLTAIEQEKEGLLEYILSSSNLNLAYRQVKRNKGSGGTDKMEVGELLPYLGQHKDELIESIRSGKYHLNPVRRVEIPKSKKTRGLGIPMPACTVNSTGQTVGFGGVYATVYGTTGRNPNADERT
jgi:hypothetical protein